MVSRPGAGVVSQGRSPWKCGGKTMDYHPRPLRHQHPLLAILACAILAGGYPGAAPAADPATGATDYDQWVARLTAKRFTGRSFATPGATVPLKLRITAVEGDETAPNDVVHLLDSKRVD